MKQSSLPFDKFSANRRKFIVNSAKAAGGFALLGLQPSLTGGNFLSPANQYTVQQVIDLILKEGGLSPLKETVDTIKSGSADQMVTGIVTTMFPTITVIEEAAKLNANFIIAHEPSFYNHKDDTKWVANNTVVKQKQQMLEKYKIAIWRFHDYCHSLKPDAISYGVAKKANWLPYYKTGQTVLTIPAISCRTWCNI
jgi:NIF3 (NGG1p interacting factor 3)